MKEACWLPARASDAERSARTFATQFGDSYYVTGVIGSLNALSGTLTWINAGHVLPMLVRNGTYAGPLRCQPSRPLGLGGPVVEVAEQSLQRGDRVLFYTDGITPPCCSWNTGRSPLDPTVADGTGETSIRGRTPMNEARPPAPV